LTIELRTNADGCQFPAPGSQHDRPRLEAGSWKLEATCDSSLHC
jgi:hypothetical protein